MKTQTIIQILIAIGVIGFLIFLLRFAHLSDKEVKDSFTPNVVDTLPDPCASMDCNQGK